MKWSLAVFAMVLGSLAAAAGAQEAVAVRVDAQKVVGKIDEKIYGQFLEHIYNSVQGGLWGQMTLNGSLEIFDPKLQLKYWELIGTPAPTPAPAPAPAPATAPSPATRPTVITEKPLNGKECVRMEQAGEGEMGLLQKRLRFEAGMNYLGSVYLRGAGTVQISILGQDGKVLGSASFTDPGDQWKKCEFQFKPAESAADGAFRLVLRGRGKVDVDLVQMFSQASLDLGGLRPDLYEAVKELRPATIRWPGGCFASRYDWKNGLGPREQRKCNGSRMWADQDYGEFGINEFAQLCKRLDSEPIIVLNFKLGVQDALDWIEYCLGDRETRWGAERIRNGIAQPLPLKRVELDNETWGMGVPAYASRVKEYSAAIRARYPQLKLIACGCNSYKQEWNRDLIAACARDFDYISVHHYSSAGGNYFVDDAAKYEAFLKELAGIIKESANPDMKVYVSEWNPTNCHSWKCGLYTGALLNAFERQGDSVEMTCPALFLRRNWVSAWNNALIHLDQGRWFAAQNYVVEKMYRTHWGPQRLAIEGGEGMDFVASRSADGKTVFVKAVNPTPQAKRLDLTLAGAFNPAKAAVRQVVGQTLDACNTMDAPDTIKEIDGQAKVEGQVVRIDLPALSVVAVKVEGK